MKALIPKALIVATAVAAGLLAGYLLFKQSDCDECVQEIRCIAPQMAKVCSVDPIGYSFDSSISNDVLKITTTGIPNHKIGLFPIYGDTVNGVSGVCGRPNEIQNMGDKDLYFPINPTTIARTTNLLNQDFGIAVNGVRFEPLAAEYWNDIACDGDDPSSLNCWMKNAPLHPDMASDLDCNMGHVQIDKFYHYHALPTGLYEALGGTYPWNVAPGSAYVSDVAPIQLGWAWDGCPIYGPVCYKSDSNPGKPNWWKPSSSWFLNSGSRKSDEPPGDYNGDYHRDYYLTIGFELLDECNGHTTVMPGYSNGVYHYHITEEYPYIPRCWTYEPQYDNLHQAVLKKQYDNQ
jgi:hypothetical protein